MLGEFDCDSTLGSCSRGSLLLSFRISWCMLLYTKNKYKLRDFKPLNENKFVKVYTFANIL